MQPKPQGSGFRFDPTDYYVEDEGGQQIDPFKSGFPDEDEQRRLKLLEHLRKTGQGGNIPQPASPDSEGFRTSKIKKGPWAGQSFRDMGPFEGEGRKWANKPSSGGLGAGAGAMGGIARDLEEKDKALKSASDFGSKVGSAFSKRFGPIAGFFSGKKKGGLLDNDIFASR